MPRQGHARVGRFGLLGELALGGAHLLAGSAALGFFRAADCQSVTLVSAAFARSGMVGLLDERPGRRGPVKLSPEVLGFLEARRRERPGASGAELASASPKSGRPDLGGAQ